MFFITMTTAIATTTTTCGVLFLCFYLFLVVLLPRAKVESRNNLETYLYNLKSSYEDSLKDKIAEDDLEELKTAVEAGLEVRMLFHAAGRPPRSSNVGAKLLAQGC